MASSGRSGSITSRNAGSKKQKNVKRDLIDQQTTLALGLNKLRQDLHRTRGQHAKRAPQKCRAAIDP